MLKDNIDLSRTATVGNENSDTYSIPANPTVEPGIQQNSGYSGIIEETLTESHYKHFNEYRGFTDLEILKMIQDGLRSVSEAEIADLGYLSKESGKPYIKGGGWVYQDKESGFIQLRPDDENLPKYLNPTGYEAKVSIPKGAQWVTEGVIDAYFIRLRGDVLCGIMAGVSHYEALPEKSGINILFDADGWKNPDVFSNLVNASKRTGGKVQLFPVVSGKGKDGAEEYFKAGNTADDLKRLLEGAYTPEQFLFELPNNWQGLPETKVTELTTRLIKLGVETLGRIQQDQLWAKLARVSKMSKKVIESEAKRVFFDTEEGKAILERKKGEKETEKCEFLQIRQMIEDTCNGELKLNQLKHCLEYKGKEINPGRYKTFVAELINKDVPREDCLEILGAIAEANAYHPVQVYLERVYAQYGDTTRHLLDDAGCRLFSPKHPLPIYNTYLRKWMIGAVARIFQPGCKFDHVLVLQGTQGKFKSTVLETLAGSDFFTDNLGDLANVKDDLLVLHSAWIHEWAEFDKVSGKREASVLKAFITRKEDRFRAPYDRAVVTHKRQSVLCGSVNETTFLIDDENRRFWIVPVDSPADIETARAERDRLWAAAVSLFKSGELPTLTSQEQQENAELNKNFQREDTWEEAIELWLSNPGNLYQATKDDGTRYFTMRDLLVGLNVPVERQTDKEQKRATRILNRMGHKPVGKIRLRKGVESVSTRAWICSATPNRNGSGTEAEQPSNINASSNSCSAVPLNSREDSRLGSFSIEGGELLSPQEKNSDVVDVEIAVSGTAERKRNNLDVSMVSVRSANSSPSGTEAVSGTTFKPGDRVQTPRGVGSIQRIQNGTEAYVMGDSFYGPYLLSDLSHAN